MDIKKIPKIEKEVLYNAADEFQETGIITKHCPRCGGKLTYNGNNSSYCITCENKCGIVFTVRGI